MSIKSSIQFLRSADIQKNLDEAVRKLNQSANKPGQPVIVYYYSDEAQKTVDCIMAVGTKEGIGKDTYSIISAERTPVVYRIYFDEMPDITEEELLHGGISIYQNKNKETFWVAIKSGVRISTRIGEKEVFLVKEATSGNYWWVRKNEIKRVDDYVSVETHQGLQKQTNDLRKSHNDLEARVTEVEKDNLEIHRQFPLTFTTEIISPQSIIGKDPMVIRCGELSTIQVKVRTVREREPRTSECVFKIIRDGKAGTDIKAIFDQSKQHYYLQLEEINVTTEFYIKAYYTDPVTKEKFEAESERYKIYFVEPSLCGKVVCDTEANKPWEIGKTLIDLLGNEERIKVEIPRGIDESSFVYRSTTMPYVAEIQEGNAINEFIFLAIPNESEVALNVDIYNTSFPGLSLMNEFIDLGTMSLTVHGASKNYSVYIKNSAVVMNGPVSYTLIEKEK